MYKKFFVFFLVLCGAWGIGVLWHRVPADPTLYFFDIGQGDATLLRTATDKRILIDGGPDGMIVGKLGALLPPADRHLDIIIGTHADLDHVGGLGFVLERYTAGMIITPEFVLSSSTTHRWCDRLQAFGGDIILLARGYEDHPERCDFSDSLSTVLVFSEDVEIPLDERCSLSVVAPTASQWHADTNRGSVVNKIICDGAVALFTGDIDHAVEAELARPGYAADLLKVSHHGSNTGSLSAFVLAVRPRVAVILVGKKNNFGHPHASVLETLSGAGAHILRTDTSGDLRLRPRNGRWEEAPAVCFFCFDLL